MEMMSLTRAVTAMDDIGMLDSMMHAAAILQPWMKDDYDNSKQEDTYNVERPQLIRPTTTTTTPPTPPIFRGERGRERGGRGKTAGEYSSV
ncbi:predicted protein [Lichtheimia corymbifera JMRC:FSU:9682]|uniref:Uncharacterized protein n=1 Tax=Lichtheimia corymbifera JMRC:FSU:9682 TaxID=1263082 RepID=A0A068RI21_9FUNG|nr:predicted protein [Lichtheimia corymbifera JMRC:FSU:9682]